MTFQPAHAISWIEIPVTDLDKASVFYAHVTGLKLSPMEGGPNPLMYFEAEQGGVAGHLYPGQPAPEGTGSTIHLIVEGTLEDTITRVWDAGGKVVSPSIEIPEGRFAYCIDLDGNSISIFEPKKAA